MCHDTHTHTHTHTHIQMLCHKSRYSCDGSHLAWAWLAHSACWAGLWLFGQLSRTQSRKAHVDIVDLYDQLMLAVALRILVQNC